MNKTEELLDATIETLKDSLVIENEAKCTTNEEKLRLYTTTGLSNVARIRLDWELSDDAATDNSKIASLMMDFLKGDLLDLLENGDVNNAQDMLLNVLNGVKQRGVKPNEVEIFHAVLLVEPKPRKESTEYTLYILLHVDWPDS